MVSRSHDMGREDILRSLTVHSGVTTAPGAAAGNTLIDSSLIGANDFITGKTILILTGNAKYETLPVIGFNTATGQITARTPGFSSQILNGIAYFVLNMELPGGDLVSYSGVTTADGAPAGASLIDANLAAEPDFDGNLVVITSGAYAGQSSEINGTTLAGTVIPVDNFGGQILTGTTFTIFAIKGSAAGTAAILAALLAREGLCFHGVVTDVPGANQFTIAGLAGLGAGAFFDLAGVNPYWAFVFRDAAGGGAAPQGEALAITNYATLTGNFTAGAFTVPIAVGDEVLIIHPFLARVLNLYGLPPANGTTTDNWQAGEATVFQFGAANTKYKCHLASVSIHNLVGTAIRIRAYRDVVGVQRKFYDQSFDTTLGTDPVAVDVINGTVGIHEIITITLLSNNVADNGQSVDYEYMLETM